METSELPVSQQLIGVGSTSYPELNLDYKKPTFMEPPYDESPWQPTTKIGPRTPLEFEILLQTYSECIRRTSDVAGKKEN